MFLSFSRNKSIVVPITVSTGAYSSEDAIDVLKTLNSVVAHRGDVAYLQSVVITDAANQKPALTLAFFNAAVTPGTDNAAFDPTDAEILASLAGIVPVPNTAYVSLNDNAVGTYIPTQPIPLKTKEDTNLYLQILSAGTPTFVATTDFSIRLTFASRT